MRAPRKMSEKKKSPRTTPPAVFVRLNPLVALEARPDGSIAAHVEGYSEPLGTFGAAAAERALELRVGLPLPRSEGDAVEREVERLIRQLAHRGLLEYRLARPGDANDLVTIEPQTPDYWPRTPKLDDAATVVLSRFAYLRRRGTEMILESPRAGALLRIHDARIAALLTILASPQRISRIRRLDGYPGPGLLALLLDCQILIEIDAANRDTLRKAEGDDGLVLWDFHDLLFHARSTEGRQASPLGGLYPHSGLIAPLPAIRPAWPGKSIKLPESDRITSSLEQLLHDRHSTRDFDDRKPINLAELSTFLNRVARVRAKWSGQVDFADVGPDIEYTSWPYPEAGSAFEIEIYLAVANCDGLTPGFYHYDADAHVLAAIDVRPQHFEAMLQSAEFAMDAPSPPQILITIAARFGRISWKYSAIAYALILKDVGVLTQTLYLVATDLGLGGCAIGTANIDLFAKMTGLDIHVEGPVGQFGLGRGKEPPPAE